MGSSFLSSEYSALLLVVVVVVLLAAVFLVSVATFSAFTAGVEILDVVKIADVEIIFPIHRFADEEILLVPVTTFETVKFINPFLDLSLVGWIVRSGGGGSGRESGRGSTDVGSASFGMGESLVTMLGLNSRVGTSFEVFVSEATFSSGAVGFGMRETFMSEMALFTRSALGTSATFSR